MQRPVLVAHSQAARPRSFCATVQATRFRGKVVGPARVTSRVRCPRVRAAVKGSGLDERTLAARVSQGIGLTIVCLVRVVIVRVTSADRARPAIVRAISVGQVDRTSANRVAPISGNLGVPT